MLSNFGEKDQNVEQLDKTLLLRLIAYNIYSTLYPPGYVFFHIAFLLLIWIYG
jgi:hypothetical protein